jgi:hypothetical protein
MSERDGMIQVHRLAFGLRVVRVNQHDFRCQSAQQKGISEAGAHVANPDNGNARWTTEIYYGFIRHLVSSRASLTGFAIVPHRDRAQSC